MAGSRPTHTPTMSLDGSQPSDERKVLRCGSLSFIHSVTMDDDVGILLAADVSEKDEIHEIDKTNGVGDVTWAAAPQCGVRIIRAPILMYEATKHREENMKMAVKAG
ncbi:hypothetical protein NDU88_006311 [Pleurodeles waltl]|uniref:Uncharacterized protein n=1 Tax=Pleurodeles waltl TaxID=8319 RepID=A0AAV7WA84_PLEWA|nr:hypothetical protein NDU88_006311 [Pleurodeles waltl]